MTNFQRKIYAGMRSRDRIALFLVKWRELTEYANVMTDQDLDGLQRICDLMLKEAKK